jgi:hypothetical protein
MSAPRAGDPSTRVVRDGAGTGAPARVLCVVGWGAGKRRCPSEAEPEPQALRSGVRIRRFVLLILTSPIRDIMMILCGRR